MVSSTWASRPASATRTVSATAAAHSSWAGSASIGSTTSVSRWRPTLSWSVTPDSMGAILGHRMRPGSRSRGVARGPMRCYALRVSRSMGRTFSG